MRSLPVGTDSLPPCAFSLADQAMKEGLRWVEGLGGTGSNNECPEFVGVGLN